MAHAEENKNWIKNLPEKKSSKTSSSSSIPNVW
jgi:hypothetical protein